MKTVKAYIILIITAFTLTLEAQICGTQYLPEEHKNKEIPYESLQTLMNRKSMIPDTIAVSVHIVESTIGVPGIQYDDILDELITVNRRYSDAGLYFVPCGAERYIEGEVSYDFNTAEILNQKYHVENTVNIFYADFVTDNISVPLCGFASFPWSGSPSSRYIMMAKGCTDNGATLAHELGHFFGLLHTHEIALGHEYVDGSNCDQAGDLICDTPADPLLGSNNVNGCTYIGNERDPQGDPYEPNPQNIMSYAPSRCRRILTAEQSAIVRFYYETEHDHLIRNCDFYPDFAIQSSTSSVIIQSGETITLDAEVYVLGLQEGREITVYFYLSDDPGEIGQIIKRDTVYIDASPNISFFNFTLDFPLNRNSGTYFLSTELDADKVIYERSESNNITVTEIEVDNSSFMDAVLFPNPAESYFRVFLRDKRLTKDILISIWNRSGVLMKTVEAYKKEDEFFVEVDIIDLPPGYYFAELYFITRDENRSFPFIKIQ